MAHRRRTKLLERTLILILLAILAGSVGGAAIGFITGRTPTSSSQ